MRHVRIKCDEMCAFSVQYLFLLKRLAMSMWGTQVRVSLSMLEVSTDASIAALAVAVAPRLPPYLALLLALLLAPRLATSLALLLPLLLSPLLPPFLAPLHTPAPLALPALHTPALLALALALALPPPLVLPLALALPLSRAVVAQAAEHARRREAQADSARRGSRVLLPRHPHGSTPHSAGGFKWCHSVCWPANCSVSALRFCCFTVTALGED